MMMVVVTTMMARADDIDDADDVVTTTKLMMMVVVTMMMTGADDIDDDIDDDVVTTMKLMTMVVVFRSVLSTLHPLRPIRKPDTHSAGAMLLCVRILTTDKNQVGEISKQFSGLLKELFTDADNFGIKFPLDMQVDLKANLLGSVFLIDFAFFEKKPGK
nr:hypothetical protein BaRGS_012041 [Batillaria attramentaria]